MKNALTSLPTILNNPHGKHRPVLIFGRHGVKRPHRTHLMRHVTRINPAMVLRHPGAALRKVFGKANLTTVVGLSGGFALGTQASRFLASGAFFTFAPAATPAFVTKIAAYRNWHGVAIVFVGGVLAMSSKKAIAKDIGMGMAVAGAYDVLARLVNGAVPNRYLPTFAGYNIPRQKVGYSIPRQPSASLHGRVPVVLGDSRHMNDYPVDI